MSLRKKGKTDEICTKSDRFTYDFFARYAEDASIKPIQFFYVKALGIDM